MPHQYQHQHQEQLRCQYLCLSCVGLQRRQRRRQRLLCADMAVQLGRVPVPVLVRVWALVALGGLAGALPTELAEVQVQGQGHVQCVVQVVGEDVAVGEVVGAGAGAGAVEDVDEAQVGQVARAVPGSVSQLACPAQVPQDLQAHQRLQRRWL